MSDPLLDALAAHQRGTMSPDHVDALAKYARKWLKYRDRHERKRLKVEVLQRDNNTCQACGSKSDLTVDHKQPLSRGGTEDESNLWILCWSCNADKGDRTVDEWYGEFEWEERA